MSGTRRTHGWLQKLIRAEKVQVHRVAHQWATSTIAKLIRAGRTEFATLAGVFLLAVALLTFVVGSLLLRETHSTLIWDEVESG